jgi:5-methylcytosine-specific restriction enzyme subunit McrC
VSVPVDKIFLMLSHAAGFADLNSITPVAASGFADHSQYLAIMLAEAGERSLRSGLPQQYSAKSLHGRSLRGRIDFPRQIRNDQRGGVALCCVADELGHDSPINRLVKTAAIRLARSSAVHPDTAARLRRLAGILACEPLATISPRVLESVRRARITEVHAAAAFIAWLAVAEQGFAFGDDGVVFGWPTTAQQLGLLFQEFVRRRLEACSPRGVRVGADVYSLHLATGVGSAGGILPRLRTDIVLSGDKDVIVVETKLMQPLVASNWSGVESRRLRADHLAQLLAYMEHAASRYAGRRIRGVLLYGACDAQIVARFPLRTYEVAVTSVDWNGAGSEVYARISEIAELLRNNDALGVPMGEVLSKGQDLAEQGRSSALGG